MNLKSHINTIENWPQPKINFYDISPLLANHNAFNTALHSMQHDFTPDYWVGIESRGFIFAAAMSQLFGGGLLIVRKEGKLPPPTIKRQYTLEYGQDTLEMKSGRGSVVIVDDLIATGGTMRASSELCEEAGYTIMGATVLIALKELHPAGFTVGNRSVSSVLQY
jgi:adenine phosphoribosyltransferase